MHSINGICIVVCMHYWSYGRLLQSSCRHIYMYIIMYIRSLKFSADWADSKGDQNIEMDFRSMGPAWGAQPTEAIII